MTPSQEATLQALLDRDDIRDVVYRYCHGVDRGDMGVLSSVYWPEARDEHGDFNGKISEFIAYAVKMTDVMKRIQHLIGNCIVRIDGDAGNAQSSFFAHHELPEVAAGDLGWNGRPGQGRCSLLVGGRYLDQLQRRDCEWRILHRSVVYDWWRYLEGSYDWNRGTYGEVALPMGANRESDPSAKLFEGPGLAFRRKSDGLS